MKKTITAAATARLLATTNRLLTITLSGGCFQNVLLLRMMTEQLAGFRLCLPGDVPANDGGLAFGQALVALARMESD